MPNKTWLDVVKESFPLATFEQADIFMWNCTSFPAGTKEHIYNQIIEAAKTSAHDIELAMKQAEDDRRFGS